MKICRYSMFGTILYFPVSLVSPLWRFLFCKWFMFHNIGKFSLRIYTLQNKSFLQLNIDPLCKSLQFESFSRQESLDRLRLINIFINQYLFFIEISWNDTVKAFCYNIWYFQVCFDCKFVQHKCNWRGLKDSHSDESHIELLPQTLLEWTVQIFQCCVL